MSLGHERVEGAGSVGTVGVFGNTWNVWVKHHITLLLRNMVLATHFSPDHGHGILAYQVCVVEECFCGGAHTVDSGGLAAYRAPQNRHCGNGNTDGQMNRPSNPVHVGHVGHVAN